jgi:esterase
LVATLQTNWSVCGEPTTPTEEDRLTIPHPDHRHGAPTDTMRAEGVAAHASPHASGLRLTPTPTSRFVTANGMRFHYRVRPALQSGGESAPQPAPTLVFLHGIMGHAFEWDAAFDVLTKRFQVIALDQRGHGRSDWTRPYTLETLGDDVVAVVEALGQDHVTLVGHSMGALAAIEAAWRHPDRFARLVTIDIAPESVSAERVVDMVAWLTSMGEAAYDGMDEPMALWRESNPIAPEPLLRHYVAHALAAGDDGKLCWAYDAAGLAEAMPTWVDPERRWRALAEIGLPALVVRGESSAFVSHDDARKMASRLANGRWVEIEGASHDMGVQRPEAVAREILAFAGR